MDDKKFLTYFIGFVSQVKLFHWATMSYAKHKALDELHSNLSDKVDLLVEVYIGKYKRQPLNIFEVSTKATTNSTKIEEYLEMNREVIDTMQKVFVKESEIQNILQEIMAEIDRTLYLCKLT